MKRSYRKAHDAIRQQKYDVAQTLFEKILQEDRSCTDAMMGLYALGVRYDGQLATMVGHIDKLGALQRELSRPIRSSYYPLGRCQVPFTDADDIRIARAQELVSAGEFQSAQLLMDRCNPANPLVDAARAAFYCDEKRYHEAVRSAQRCLDAPVIGYDVHSIMGISLEQMGLHNAAAQSFSAAREVADTPFLEKTARYNLAVCLLDGKQTKHAQQLLESLYVEDAEFRDVAGLLLQLRDPAHPPTSAEIPNPQRDHESPDAAYSYHEPSEQEVAEPEPELEAEPAVEPPPPQLSPTDGAPLTDVERALAQALESPIVAPDPTIPDEY